MKVVLLLYVLVIIAISRAAPSQQRIEQDPELTAGFFEGDMVLDNQRNGIRNTAIRWPNKIVYYYINDHFDAAHRNYILQAMQIIEAVSCIRFEEVTPDQPYYVNITGLPGGCYATVGFLNIVQNFNLQIYPLDSGCFRMGTIVHEFLHTIGFLHMQSTYNRDEYVHIATENIQPGTEDNFAKYGENLLNDFGEQYDYASVMHYPPNAFSKNGQMTIIPLKNDPNVIHMGQRIGMTATDISKLNEMYNCPLRV